MDNKQKESQETGIQNEEVSEGKKQQQKNVFVIISAIVLILLSLLIFKFPPRGNGLLSAEQARVQAEDFINDNLMMPGTKATITDVKDVYGLYELTVYIGSGDSIISYINKQGTKFYPEALDVDTYVNPYLLDDFMYLDDEMDVDAEPIEIIVE